MTALRTAAQQALEALEDMLGWQSLAPQTIQESAKGRAAALRAALAEPVQEPEEFDHSIGADRFRVVRGAFWWHVLIGDSPTEHGKFRSQASAQKMAADLLREFRNGAFVQHEAALAQQTEPYRLPDDLYDSTDWRAGTYADRVAWLHAMYESAKKERDALLYPPEPLWPATGLEPRGCPLPGACSCPSEPVNTEKAND